MIREMSLNDLNEINEIGSQIKDNFVKNYNLEEYKNMKWLKVYVYEEAFKILGFIVIAKNYENIDIYAIAVESISKKKGIGSKLLEYTINNEDYETITLEVRSKNIAAINLYTKYNFEIINTRKKYYDNDDALVMQYKNSKGSI